MRSQPFYVSTYNTRWMLWLNLALATATLLVAGIALPVHAEPGGQVHGSVFTEVQDRHLPLPGITVYVKNVLTSTLSLKVTTDINGRFVVPEQPAGTYQLCWEAQGFGSACKPEPVAIEDSPVPVLSVAITPEGGVILGRVTLADGAPCHYLDGFFGVDVVTTVTLSDQSGANIQGTVVANAAGDYLLPKVPQGTVWVQASCEGAVVETTVTVDEAGVGIADLSLPSHRPVIADVVAVLDGQAVKGVPAGSTVEVTATATDPDGDPLHYRWGTTTPGFASADASTVQWTLPQTGGLHMLDVLVADGKGGYRFGRVEVSTDEGVVLKETGGAAAPAVVESQTTLTLSAALPPLPVYDVSTTFLTFNGMDDEQSACNYYKAIKAVSDCQLNDPNNPNDNILVGAITFDEWKARNGLAVNPDVDGNGSQFDLVDQLINFIFHQEVSALYLNAADLNLARAMHGRRGSEGVVAYYVCNHRTLEDARRNLNLLACVAMDYSVVPGVNSDQPFIKFYVFEPTGLSLSAALDSQGRKFIPGLCKACHGSDKQPRQAFSPSQGPDLGSHFLPFDLDNFEFLDRPRFTRNAQEVAFRELNQFIYHSQPAPVVKQLLDGWYPGGTGKQQSNFVPPGWVGHERLYLNVVKPSCRICHAAVTEFYNWNRFESAPADDPATPLLKEDRGGFKNMDITIHSRVCSQKLAEMPNAEVTFTRFWLSEGLPDPHDQPKILREFFQEVMLMDPTCPAPPLLP